MSPARIEKLKELARRGVDGERDTARRMLHDLGVSWEPSLMDKLKDTFRSPEKVQKYTIDMKYPSDLLFMALLQARFCIGERSLHLRNVNIMFEATPSEMEEIKNAYFSDRKHFNSYATHTTKDYIRKY